MTVKSLGAFAVALTAAFGAFADAANVLVSFSTTGPDVYADGKTVLDGEWYALVWSQDGAFEGLNVDCTPADPNDLVVLMAPLAKSGRCPFTVFQIDSKSAKAKTSGVYAVYLLDTRTADKTAVATNVGGKPSAVNAAVASKAYAASGSLAGGASEKAMSGAAWAASSVDTSAADFKQPKIAAIQVAGDRVKITVSDMMPGLKYNVLMGADVGKLETYGLEVPKATVAGEDVTFEIAPNDARFFKVTREPLTK